jgi:hypothetical protein
MRARADLALVALERIEHREERRAVLAVAPVGVLRRLVPHLPRLRDVVVLLRVVRAVPARLAEELREHLFPRGEGDHAPHVLRAEARGIHARDDGRPRRRADGRIRPAVRVEHPALGERVHVWRRRVGVAVAAHVRPVILARDPEDVRPRRIRRGKCGAGEQHGEKRCRAEQPGDDGEGERFHHARAIGGGNSAGNPGRDATPALRG